MWPSPSSSPSLPQKKFEYGVFLSFNGKDTRTSFTDHLYSALTRQGIETFRDDQSLERGEDFAPELLRAIGESWGSIIVISERYALSHWFLEELVEIMKQRKGRGHRVYPIFYYVEPSDFRYQINSVKEAFNKHERKYNRETTQGWRVALKEVTGIHGWPLKQDQYESVFIEDIVKDVSRNFYAENLDHEQEIEKMKSTFRTIQAWLVDAENKQYMKKGEAVKVWLDKLKHFAYDMDDVLDEWNTALLKSKIEKDQDQTPSTSSCSLSKGQNVPLKIKELNERYQAIVREKDDFPFARGLNNSWTHLTLERRKTTSLIDESDVFGRDHYKDKLIRLLLSDNNGEGGSGKRIPLLGIVGMGGIGKTTLAQLAYKSHEVKKHFDRRIWVCVSDPFDEIRIANAILEALEVPSSSNELETLLQEICQNIERKKFLLVLDDVWTEDEEKWKPLRISLGFGSKKSKILVTTRNEKVARILGCATPFSLEILSKEDSWSLFSKIAFSQRSNEDCGNLESIGREFVEKCAGLPLAIKTLASLLRFKETEEQWRRVLVSEIWNFKEVEKDLYIPLLLSYYDLPDAEKQCFRYCAVFPKDHRIEKDDLIKFWMAQGFLGETRGGNDLEIMGEECFNNLAIRGLFQQFEKDEIDGSIIECKMHDIVHDFAQFLTKTECFMVESDGIEVLKRVEPSRENVRHLTLVKAPSNQVAILDTLKKLRSFLFLSGDTCEPTLYSSLSKLRLISLMDKHWRVKKYFKIPKEIGKLTHLRYLNMQGSPLYELPEALCDLCNLQTLNIRSCQLHKWPHGMEKLINLRHLQNRGTNYLSFMPKGIRRLTCLQTLEKFVVEKGGGIESETSLRLVDLGELIHLRGHMTITGLGNVGEAEASEAGEARLSTKAGLRSLTLEFDRGYYKDEPHTRMEDEASVLQALHPPQGLLKLQIHYLKGPAFPNWMTSLTSLKSVMLDNCGNWESLPPMGKLPSLEFLSISRMDKVKKVGQQFLGAETSSSASSAVNHSNNIAFPNLQMLKFLFMKGWEEWECDDRVFRRDDSSSFFCFFCFHCSSSPSSSSNINTIIMPKLQCLSIICCPKLKTLPCHLLQSRALQELEILNSPILYQRYNKETGKDWPSISHILTFRI